MKFRVIGGRTVHDVVMSDIPRCISLVRDTYAAHGRGETINPNSYFMMLPYAEGARIVALPASLRNDPQVSGLKWIASYPSNVKQGMPRASGVLILNDVQTGIAFACIEAAIISASRTAASAVLCAHAVNPDRTLDCLGIIGNGLIARYIYQFMLADGWSIRNVVLFDTDPSEAKRFAARVIDSSRHENTRVAASSRDVLQNSDLAIFATTAATPHVKKEDVGAVPRKIVHMSLRDLEPDLIAASNNIVDDVDHVMNANTSVHLAEQRYGNRDFINGTLDQALQRKAPLDSLKSTVFSLFGLGVLDLAVGMWVLDEAMRKGTAVEIPDFVYETER